MHAGGHSGRRGPMSSDEMAASGGAGAAGAGGRARSRRPLPPTGSAGGGSGRSGGRRRARKRPPKSGGAAAERNPFTLPSDEEVFLLRDEERKRKREEARRAKKLRVWEKGTISSHMGTTAARKLEGRGGELTKEAKATRGLVAAATAAISADRRRERENTAEFIAKKREMFLVQMSLDTKREEIRKLEEKAQMKEEALKKSELMLEEDAIRFDTFLKENDKKAHEAIKKAEAETKLKAEKAQEIKKLNQQIQALQSEKAKLAEQLDDCIMYREFLDKLTPADWFEEQRKLKRERQEARRVASFEAKLAAWEEAKAKAAQDALDAEAAEREAAEREGRSYRRRGDRVRRAELALPPPPVLEEEALESSGDDLPMYFTEPHKLLDIFTTLEESNLFLIQNSQETEQALEELKQNYEETRRKMDEKTRTLAENIEELKSQIRTEEQKAEELRRRAEASTGVDFQDELLAKLHGKVSEVYQKCGFDAEADPSTLAMLTDLEVHLEELLAEIDTMPREYVLEAEQEKEKQRRERVREERMQILQQQYEERLKKSMKRSQEPVHKKTGKMIMFRSAPLRKKVRREEEDADEDRADENARFFI
eukprot:PLAT5103.1.p1 GENE.PLAT5103.1~~PLAT5103.1.p1  ORF type:complete len:597 (-),score=356.24 PLAT5103.1:111-1901(-)